MSVEIVTKEDLENFKVDLIKNIQDLCSSKPPKKWLKTFEVMELLGLSEVKLQMLRDKRIIPFSKLGGICYYNIDDIDKVLKDGIVADDL